jgi:serine protease Do
MPVSRTCSALLGTAFALLTLIPWPFVAANGGTPNLTHEQQQAGAIALPSLAPLAQHVLPAVVNISAQLDEQTATTDEGDGDQEGSGGSVPQPSQTPFDQLLRRFFQNPFSTQTPGQRVMALGSGVIINPQGYIVTNNHVVANAEKVTIILQDKSQHTATVVGRDERTDLALMKITADKPLPFVTWGNSDNAQVGDWVVAVGNPFGLGGTVTAGIISALGRNINEGPYDDFLQIDAPINRGNSGGPTFDLAGQVVGINTAIYSPSGGSVGIGFAIPSNLAKYVVGELEAHGSVTWGWLGVSIQNISPSIARGLGLDPQHPEGALVASVVSGSPADSAGLKSGDVIVAAGDHPIGAAHDLPRVVAETRVGTKLDLAVKRNGKQRTIPVTIRKMPAELASAAPGEGQPSAIPSRALGLELAPLASELRKKLKIGDNVSGVVVTGVAGNTAAAIGIQPGDVIQSVDQKPVTSPRQAAAALREAAKSGNVLLLINRHGASEFVGLSVQNRAG